MKIVQGDEIALDSRSSHRGGVVSYIRLLEGEANTLDNYSLILARTPGRFSPRHRHNFEQFRLQLEGNAFYGRSGTLKPGMLGYFPEGVHYGPQTQGADEILTSLVLQCGGASGAGYLGREGEVTFAEELKSFGEFRGGVFRRREGLPGKRNLDAFQAIWEHVNGRPLVYPKPRYEKPILIDPENFDWVPVEGHCGVAEKFLGSFTERRTMASFIRLDPGARFEVTGQRDLYYVLKGQGTVSGRSLRPMTAIFLDAGEHGSFSADKLTEMVHLRLPNLAALKSRSESFHAIAAE